MAGVWAAVDSCLQFDSAACHNGESMKIKKEDIYLKNNPQGFEININNEYVNNVFRRFMQWKGYRVNEPISNAERFEFEHYFKDLISKSPPLS